MQINTVGSSLNPYVQNDLIPTDKTSQEFKDKIKNGEISGKALSESYLVQYSLSIQANSSSNFEAQTAPFDMKKIGDILDSIDFEAIGYTGKPIKEMSPDEAKALVGQDGFFGVDQTSARLSDFVLSGAGDNIDTLKAGREGIVKGFNDAEKMWGGKLPDISYQTLDKALAKIDEKITSLGGSILDTSV
ncbi:MAG: hydrogenase-4 component G [Campylobacterales bacterium]|nr:hydrogenase-4 component G [Campylobacterales bacterium]